MAQDESNFTSTEDDKSELSASLRRRYVPIRQLGKGGQGVVHLVEDRFLGGRLVVVKSLRPQADEEWRSAFRHEFEALAGLKHPRLSEVYDFGTTQDGLIYFTRDFVAGDDLFTATQEMECVALVALSVEICRALKPLHSRGLVHGDLKPGNIICSAGGLARLIDFSFVRASNEDAKRRGTVPYMAPEVIEGRRADARADLYSLGATLFEVMSGAPPFEGSVSEVVKGHLSEWRPTPLPRRIRRQSGDADVVSALTTIILRLLANDPEDRYPNIDELEAALTAAAPKNIKSDSLRQYPVVSEFHGRDREIDRIREAVIQRFGPSDLSPLVVVVGELGTGKGAMLRAVKWWAELEEIAVLEMRGSGNLLLPVAGIIEQAIAYLKGDEAISRAEQLLSVLAEPPGRGAHMDGLTKAVGELLVHVAKEFRLILFAEGIDQASSETLTVLQGLIAAVEREHPVAMVCSTEKSFPWQARLGSGEVIEMPLLTESEIAPLAACFLGSDDAQVTQRILAHTGGNPLFVTTLLWDLASSPEGATRLEQLGPPQQLERYWRDRFDGLHVSERLLLAAAAVLNRPAKLKELAAVAEADESTFKASLPTLEVNGWLRHSADGWHLSSAPLGLEILGVVDPELVSSLHESAMNQERDEARQLFHAAKCGARQRLRERTIPVALSLRRMGALQAARDLLEVSREALDDADEVLQIRLELGRICLAQGDLSVAETHLTPLAKANDPALRREALMLLGRLHSTKRELETAEAYLVQALAIDIDSMDKARALFELANVAFKKGDFTACIASCEAGLTGMPKGNPVRADLLGMLAKAAVREGRHEDALIHAKEAETDAHLAGDMRSMALAIDILAWVNQCSGNLTKAVLEMERAVRLNREFGDLPRLIRGEMVLGDLKMWLEDWPAALRYYEQAVRLVRTATNPALRLDVQNNFAFALIKVGSFERAQLVLSDVEQIAREQGHQEQRLFSLFHMGVLAAARGELDEALERYEAARRGFEQIDRPAIVCEIELEMALVLLWRNQGKDLSAARNLIAEAAARERDEEGRLFEEALALQTGTLRVVEGRLEEGIAILDELCEKAKSDGSMNYAWQAHFAAAQGYLAGETTFMARRRLREAEQILEKLSTGLSPEHRLAFWQDVRRAEVRNLLTEISSSNQFSSSQLIIEAEGGLDAEARALYRVLELNKQLLGAHDLDQLLEMILSSAIELTGAERGLILLPPEGSEKGILEISSTTDSPHDRTKEEETFSRSIAESVFLDGEPVVTIDAMRDNRFNEFLSIHELKLKSVACLPVSYRGKPLGVLYLENRLRRGRFDGKDLRVIAAFADQVAIAISQARLISEAMLRTQELEKARGALQEAYEKKIEDLNMRDHDLKLARDRLKRMRQHLEGEGEYHGAFGHSETMTKVFSLMERVKDLNVPVVFIGESGTGKDLLARVLHERSNLKNGPFVVAGCGSIPETLVESMLFGHEKGAFSGADIDRMGLLRAAEGGTLYLDELGDMSPRMQVDLLRVLQEKSFTPLGSAMTMRANVRIITSSRVPLEKLVSEGGLRQDLLYRLKVVTIELPPLRRRRDDILPLARRILDREAAQFQSPRRGLSKEAATALLNHHWPGNVRELEQILRRALAIGEGVGLITPEELFGELSSAAGTAPPPSLPRSVTISKLQQDDEAARILAALEQVKWNRTKAAELLGIPRRTFYRKIEKLGLVKKRRR